jgi:hypothetical protein
VTVFLQGDARKENWCKVWRDEGGMGGFFHGIRPFSERKGSP